MKKYQFIVELGKALHIYGIPSYKIQSYLTEVAKTKGIVGSFMDFPTWIHRFLQKCIHWLKEGQKKPRPKPSAGARSKMGQWAVPFSN